MGSPLGSLATIWTLRAEFTLQRIMVGSVTMGGMLPNNLNTPHWNEWRPTGGNGTPSKLCRWLTVDLSHFGVINVCHQGILAQLRAAGRYGVQDTQHVALTAPPHLLHLSRTDTGQQVLRGDRLQWFQWRWREQQALWVWYRPCKHTEPTHEDRCGWAQVFFCLIWTGLQWEHKPQLWFNEINVFNLIV